jgi:hypothetical protein
VGYQFKDEIVSASIVSKILQDAIRMPSMSAFELLDDIIGDCHFHLGYSWLAGCACNGRQASDNERVKTVKAGAAAAARLGLDGAGSRTLPR